MATTTNYSWTTPDDTDLVKDGAAAIRTLGSSADTTVKDLNPGTTAGDIDYYTSSTAKARIAIGTAGQFLAVNSGATAPEWVAAPGGGKVLQMVEATFSTSATTTSSSFADTGLTASITCAAATSKVLVQIFISEILLSSSQYASGNFRIVRDATTIQTTNNTLYAELASNRVYHYNTFILDTPASASALTYKVQYANANAGSNVNINSQSGTGSRILLTEIGA